MDRFVQNRVFRGMVYALLALFLLYFIILLRPIIVTIYGFLEAVLTPFLIALIISYVLNPVVSLLSERKVPRTASVLLIYIVFIAVATTVLMNVIPMFMSQVKELNEHIPELTIKAQNLQDGLSSSEWLPPAVRKGIDNGMVHIEKRISNGINHVVSGIGTTLNVLFIAFLVPFMAFYMLKDFQLMERTVLAIVPKKHRKPIVKMLLDIDAALGSYIRGQFIVCVVIGGLAYVAYWAIGMPYPLLLASIVALFNVIPYVGPFFGAAPALVVASTISLKMVVLVAIVNFGCQVLEGNVISPQVVGRSMHLHPLLIIFAVLVGGELAGIVGLILAVPLFAVGKVVLQHLFAYYLRRRTI